MAISRSSCHSPAQDSVRELKGERESSEPVTGSGGERAKTTRYLPRFSRRATVARECAKMDNNETCRLKTANSDVGVGIPRVVLEVVGQQQGGFSDRETLLFPRGNSVLIVLLRGRPMAQRDCVSFALHVRVWAPPMFSAPSLSSPQIDWSRTATLPSRTALPPCAAAVPL
jgi:hypothetical protein